MDVAGYFNVWVVFCFVFFFHVFRGRKQTYNGPNVVSNDFPVIYLLSSPVCI